ncbi:MAG: lipoprotein insertase outer membrane protein LolB, partial [Gammaproteobacteria bacterium]|nr:lipoprotein insertase outer membrane protein LolB [Gammaproteobacteria bacterium]
MLPTILIGLLLLLSGCAAPPIAPEPLSSKQLNRLTEHQLRLDEIQSWKLKGRMAIHYNGESWNATVHWQHSPDHYDIQLFLPLGQGSLHLRGNHQSATLETSDGGQFEARDGETLFFQQFGLIFPVTALHDWVIGRPAN